ncbi:MAG: hypothetical protein ACRC1R_10385 [Cetobacterium sp.]|uniref:hypothetical protein n=1 Tax=Cetobacterium sp. TaxID=2071632 RepID=UPI003F3E735C
MEEKEHEFIMFFKQNFVVKYKLDSSDRELLIILFRCSGNKKIVKKEIGEHSYFLLDYKKFLEKFPGLDFSSSETLRRKLDNYVKLGLIEKIVQRNGEQKGTNIFIRFLSKFYEIYRSQGSSLNNIENNNKKDIIYTPQEESGVESKIILLEKENKRLLRLCYEKLLSSEERDEIDRIARNRAKNEMPEAMEGVIKTLVNMKYRPMVLGEIFIK